MTPSSVCSRARRIFQLLAILLPAIFQVGCGICQDSSLFSQARYVEGGDTGTQEGLDSEAATPPIGEKAATLPELQRRPDIPSQLNQIQKRPATKMPMQGKQAPSKKGSY